MNEENTGEPTAIEEEDAAFDTASGVTEDGGATGGEKTPEQVAADEAGGGGDDGEKTAEELAEAALAVGEKTPEQVAAEAAAAQEADPLAAKLEASGVEEPAQMTQEESDAYWGAVIGRHAQAPDMLQSNEFIDWLDKQDETAQAALAGTAEDVVGLLDAFAATAAGGGAGGEKTAEQLAEEVAANEEPKPFLEANGLLDAEIEIQDPEDDSKTIKVKASEVFDQMPELKQLFNLFASKLPKAVAAPEASKGTSAEEIKAMVAQEVNAATQDLRFENDVLRGHGDFSKLDASAELGKWLKDEGAAMEKLYSTAKSGRDAETVNQVLDKYEKDTGVAAARKARDEKNHLLADTTRRTGGGGDEGGSGGGGDDEDAAFAKRSEKLGGK